MTRTTVPSPGRCSAWNSAFRSRRARPARRAPPGAARASRCRTTTSSTPPLSDGGDADGDPGGWAAPDAPGRATRARSGRADARVLAERVAGDDVRLDPDPAPPRDPLDEQVHGGREALLAERVRLRAPYELAQVAARFARQARVPARRSRAFGRFLPPRRGHSARPASARLRRDAGPARRESALRAASARLARRGAARRAPACGRRHSIDHRLAKRDGDRLRPVSASSLTRMCRTWLLTVSWLMKSRPATSALDIPSARSWRISRSRGVSESPPSRPWIRFGHQRRVDERLAGGDLVDGAQERLVRSFLEDVALGAGLEASREERPFAVGGEDDHGGVGRRA